MSQFLVQEIMESFFLDFISQSIFHIFGKLLKNNIVFKNISMKKKVLKPDIDTFILEISEYSIMNIGQEFIEAFPVNS